MNILTDNGLMVLWQKIKDLYKKTSVSAKQTTTSTADGGTNVMTFTFGDGTSTTLSVKNGSKGSDGARGATGAKGEKGDRGPVGETGPQGNSGIADASNKALINDAVTGGATSYLSAEVGKLGILTYDCSKGGTVKHASLQDAINAVPTTFRKAGVSIIYKSEDSIYRYALKSSSWSSDSANWFSVEEKVSNLLPKRDFERSYIGQQDFSIDVKSDTNVSTDFDIFIPQGMNISLGLIHKILNDDGSFIVNLYYNDNTKVQKVIGINVFKDILIEKTVTKIQLYLDKSYINSNGNIVFRVKHIGLYEHVQNVRNITTSRIYTGTSPKISAYSGAWCYVKPLYIAKGTKSKITVKSSSNSIRESKFKLSCVRPDGTYFETNAKFREGDTVDYIFEDNVVSVGKYITLTKDGTFSISIETESIFNRVESLENGTNFKYPLYPIWGHEYLSAWYYKMYMSSSQTSFKIVCAGDSTTKNGSTDVYIKRLMTLRGYKDENINCLNMGVDGQQTLSWIGYNDKDEMTGETTPQYGYLHKQMQESPDLLIIRYGLNDGSNIQFPDLSFEERAANFESRLREGLGRIRTNNTYESGPSYNKSANELSIIIVTPISVSSSNNAKTEATADKWCKLINPIIKKVCRDFQCAYADFTTREYDHEWSKNWSISKDGVHPDSFIQKEMISMLSDLICPICYTVI